MSLTTGSKLGPYEVLTAVGAGGMGEVYQARDTRLDRNVAIKVLPTHLSSDPDLRARFEREAKAISGLQHQNICVLYDVGSQDGVDFLVMEYLEGETLSARMLRKPLTQGEVLKIGIEVADALDKAHHSGIIHRDLKPANVMLTKSGAKLMDFGLAKPLAMATGAASGAPAFSAAATLATPSPITVTGTVVGTVQYMSPEQIQGQEADARSDIFAFGAMLYEMVTGKKPFDGKTQLTVAGAILERDPEPISTLQPLASPALGHVIERALAKDPAERWQSASDIKNELRWITEGGSKVGVPAIARAHRKHRETLAWGIAGVLALASLGLGVGYVMRAPAAPRQLRVSIPAPDKYSIDPFTVTLSPDGTKLAFVAAGGDPVVQQLWIRSLDSTIAQPLGGTESASFPFWSPDSKRLGFFTPDKLKIVEASGGGVQALASVSAARGGTWSQENIIVYTPGTGDALMRISAAGGTPVPVTKLAQGSSSHRWPFFLPDGRHFLFMDYQPASVQNAGSKANVVLLGSLGSDQFEKIVSTEVGATFANGKILFLRDANLMAQQLDPKTGKLAGDPVLVAEQVQVDPRGIAAFTASAHGELAFTGGQAAGSRMLWYDRSGKPGDMIDEGFFQDSYLAPDGKKIGAAKLVEGHLALFIYDLQRGTKAQFTFSKSRDDDAVFSPDGKMIVFDSQRTGSTDLYLKPADGSRQEELLYHDDNQKYATSWSADGKYLAYEGVLNGQLDAWILPMTGEKKPYMYLGKNGHTRYPKFSPDGRWLAYQSNESGHDEVYIVAFPKPGGKFLVGTGTLPVWRGDSRELFYADDKNRITAVSVNANGESVELGRAEILFPFRPLGAGVFDVTRDGKKFLMLDYPEQRTSTVTLVVNWQAAKKD